MVVRVSSPSGGIGRRKGLKILRLHWCAGSSPASGITQNKGFQLSEAFIFYEFQVMFTIPSTKFSNYPNGRMLVSNPP